MEHLHLKGTRVFVSECVCAECQNYPDTTLFVVNMLRVSAGGSRSLHGTGANEDTHAALVMRIGTPTRVPARDTSPFGPLFVSLCVLQSWKQSVSPLENPPTRDSPAVLERRDLSLGS